jgi:hypothetical protein
MTDAPLPPVAGDGCLVVLAVATLVLALICRLGLALMIVRHHNDQPPIIVVPPPAHVPGRLRYQPATLWRGSKRCPLISRSSTASSDYRSPVSDLEFRNGRLAFAPLDRMAGDRGAVRHRVRHGRRPGLPSLRPADPDGGLHAGGADPMSDNPYSPAYPDYPLPEPNPDTNPYPEPRPFPNPEPYPEPYSPKRP